MRTRRKARTIAERTVILRAAENSCWDSAQTADSGLLARMWELPAYEGALKPPRNQAAVG